MKIRWNNRYVRWGLTAFFVISANILLYYLLFQSEKIALGFNSITSILMPVVFGFIMAYLLTPLLNKIEENIIRKILSKCKVKDSLKVRKYTRILSVTLTMSLFLLLIYSLIRMMLSQIVPSIESIISNFDTYIDNISEWIDKILEDNPEIQIYAENMLDRYSTELENFLNDTVLSKSTEFLKTISLSIWGIFKVTWNFFVGIIISIYLLSSKEMFSTQAKKLCYAFFEKDSANVIINNLRFTHNTFISFIGGKIVDSIIIGLLCFIGTTFLGTPYKVLVSVIIGVTNVIPFFGPFLGAIPCTILVLVVDPMHPLNVVYFIIFILILQQIDGNLIGPKILGSSTGLSSFWVIFSITLFGGFFGVFGMIIGVPVFAVIYVAIKSKVNSKLIKKDLPITSDIYSDVECVDDAGVHAYDIKGRRAAIKKRNEIKREGKSYDGELLSGMSFISNVEEWKRRVPVRWDDASTITKTVYAYSKGTDETAAETPVGEKKTTVEPNPSPETGFSSEVYESFISEELKEH